MKHHAHRLPAVCTVALLSLGGATLGWTASHREPAPAEAAGPLGAFETLAGTWRAEVDGLHFEESWLPSRGGNMSGVFRLSAPDGAPRVLEILTLTAQDDGSVLQSIRHFGADLAPWASEAAGPLVLRAEKAAGPIVALLPHANADAVRTATFDFTNPDALKFTLQFAAEGRPPLDIEMRRVK